MYHRKHISKRQQHDLHGFFTNALANVQIEVGPLPVDSSSRYAVESLQADMEWSAIDSSLIPQITSMHKSMVLHSSSCISFRASDVPPLGVALFRIGMAEEKLDPFPAIALMSSVIEWRLPLGQLRVSANSKRLACMQENS